MISDSTIDLLELIVAWTAAVIGVGLSVVFVGISLIQTWLVLVNARREWKTMARIDQRTLIVVMWMILLLGPAYYAGFIWLLQPYLPTLGEGSQVVLLMSPMPLLTWTVYAGAKCCHPRPVEPGTVTRPPVPRRTRVVKAILSLAAYGAVIWLGTVLFPQWIGTASFFVLAVIVPMAWPPGIALAMRPVPAMPDF